MKFKYIDNKKHEVLLEVEAETIAEADEKLKDKTGLNAVKCPWIGCQIQV